MQMISYPTDSNRSKHLASGFTWEGVANCPRIDIPKLVGCLVGTGCDSAKDTGWQACDDRISCAPRDRRTNITSELSTSHDCVILQIVDTGYNGGEYGKDEAGAWQTRKV